MYLVVSVHEGALRHMARQILLSVTLRMRIKRLRNLILKNDSKKKRRLNAWLSHAEHPCITMKSLPSSISFLEPAFLLVSTEKQEAMVATRASLFLVMTKSNEGSWDEIVPSSNLNAVISPQLLTNYVLVHTLCFYNDIHTTWNLLDLKSLLHQVSWNVDN